ncbi:MAG: hypothetical protein JKX85_01840 [Phycisphaeraceae bacterium]|nr:hypothetical protein [Phycisphaeraceae bacterium]
MQRKPMNTKMLIASLILIMGSWSGVQAVESQTASPLVHEVRLSLSSGDVDLGPLLGQLLDWLGVNSQRVRQRCANVLIPVTGTVGEIKLEVLGALTHGAVTFTVSDDELVMRLDRLAMREQNKAIRLLIKEKMAGWFPDLAQQAYGQYGLWSVRPGGILAGLPHTFQMDHVVVLVHGLDEPGDIWDELIVSLKQAGHTPLVFVYPNDQLIVDSATLLTEQLTRLSSAGIKSVSLVAHSMGGLVSREMLTNEQMQGYPKVRRLITVGTPHHGSTLAHFQFVGELREQIVKMFSGNGVLFGSMFDGLGEAKIDLLPGSVFLTTLNARPLPKDVAMTSIIGIASPVKISSIRAFEKKFASELTAQGQHQVSQVRKGLEQLVAGVGDGCVSLSSAHLQGVLDEVVVEANHRTMLRTVPLISHGQPPAIAVILKRLSSDLDK